MAIIPQQPVVFSGSIKKNIDPLEEFTDSDVWKVLEEV
jgi:ATP-binding cassette subfamily C (CFTR/MRP) protein 4